MIHPSNPKARYLPNLMCFMSKTPTRIEKPLNAKLLNQLIFSSRNKERMKSSSCTPAIPAAILMYSGALATFLERFCIPLESLTGTGNIQSGTARMFSAINAAPNPATILWLLLKVFPQIMNPIRPSRVHQIRGSTDEATGLSAIAVRQALATAEAYTGHTSRIADPAFGGIIGCRLSPNFRCYIRRNPPNTLSNKNIPD